MESGVAAAAALEESIQKLQGEVASLRGDADSDDQIRECAVPCAVLDTRRLVFWR